MIIPTFIDYNPQTPITAAWLNAVSAAIWGSGVVRPQDYGTAGSGLTDDTPLLQAAANALAATGGTLLLPPGVYLYTTLTLPPGVNIQGTSSFSSVLMQSTATGDGILMEGDNTISNVQLNHKVPKTSGRTVWMQGNNCTLRDFEAYGYYQLWDAQAPGGGIVIFPKVMNGNISSPSVAAGSNLGTFSNYANALASNLSVSGPASGTQPGAGITLVNGDTCFIDNVNITRHGIALLFAPQVTYNCFATYVSNSIFDSSNSLGNCLMNAPGKVLDTSFSNCWFGLATGASGYGCNLSPAAGGVVDGVAFNGCEFPMNSTIGLNASLGATNIVVSGGYASGSIDGYRFQDVTHFSLVGVRSGNVAQRGGNSQYGCVIAGACDYYNVAFNDFSVNSVGGINDTGTGTHKNVVNNLS